MPSQKKTDEKPQDTAPTDLADGAASTDAAVHQLLANRYIASLNSDEEAAQAATDELAKLGYR